MAALVTSGTLIGLVSANVVGAGALIATPSAPTNVNIVQSGPSPDLTVTWTDPTSGPAATGALVQLYGYSTGYNATATLATAIICGNSCTTATFRALAVGTPYAALIWPTNAAGYGVPVGTKIIAPTSTCKVGACVTFDATTPIGAATHAASGLTDSVFPVGNDAADLTSLGMNMYRGTPNVTSSGNFDWTDWNEVVAAGAQTTLVLSNLWSGENGSNPPTPWSNWSAYASWVTSTVQTIVASGEKVSYWDPMNEPGEPGYYSAANFATATPALLLEQFLVTYDAIKAVDPSAAVIGPSLEHWSDYPAEYNSGSTTSPAFDMVTFLNFAVANHIQLAAISWHAIDNGLGPNPTENTLLPVNLVDQVAEARQLLAARPSLGSPLIFINEYGIPDWEAIPGWDVAALAAFTDAGVNSGDLACWSDDCATPTLDGLLGYDGTSTTAEYWERMVYASMSGNMITTTSSNDEVTAVGSYNSSSNTVTGLVGRGVGCSQTVACEGDFPTLRDAGPTSVTVTLTVPWSSGKASVSLSDIPGQDPSAAVGEPTPTNSTATITPAPGGKGTITISIPSFADGDAYGFTVTNSAS
jgi:hypothetical protein